MICKESSGHIVQLCFNRVYPPVCQSHVSVILFNRLYFTQQSSLIYKHNYSIGIVKCFKINCLQNYLNDYYVPRAPKLFVGVRIKIYKDFFTYQTQLEIDRKKLSIAKMFSII